MKIIEALKEFPLLQKRIDKNVELLQKYSSELSIGIHGFTFGTFEDQTKEVDALLQATNDLVARRAKLRNALAITNSSTVVKFCGKERTITEWIEYREKGIDFQLKALNALNDRNAGTTLQQKQGQVDLGAGVKIVRFYDEKKKNDMVNQLMEERAMLDAQLEIVNATTDLSGGI